MGELLHVVLLLIKDTGASLHICAKSAFLTEAQIERQVLEAQRQANDGWRLTVVQMDTHDPVFIGDVLTWLVNQKAAVEGTGPVPVGKVWKDAAR